MLIAAGADFHGNIGFEYPECDVAAIVGDLMPLYSSAENWQQHRELHWLETKGMRWLRRMRKRCGRMLVCPGNHDLVFAAPDTREVAREILAFEGIVLIDDPSIQEVIDGVVFTGYPYTPTIQDRNWAFSQRRTSQAVKICADLIPLDTDVLLTHGPPQGLLDRSRDSDRTGCAALMHRMLEVGPAVTFTGHIHEQRGRRAWYYDLSGRARRIVNCSIVDENYVPRGGKVQTYELRQ